MSFLQKTLSFLANQLPWELQTDELKEAREYERYLVKRVYEQEEALKEARWLRDRLFNDGRLLERRYTALQEAMEDLKKKKAVAGHDITATYQLEGNILSCQVTIGKSILVTRYEMLLNLPERFKDGSFEQYEHFKGILDRGMMEWIWREVQAFAKGPDNKPLDPEDAACNKESCT